MIGLKSALLLALILLLKQSNYAQEIWSKHPAPVLEKSGVFPNWKGLTTDDAYVMQDNDTLKMWYSREGWLNAFLSIFYPLVTFIHL